jgi:hypothetical protein
MNHKILQVTIEYEDETISLDKEDAEKWKEYLHSLNVMATACGKTGPQIEWKVVKKNDV